MIRKLEVWLFAHRIGTLTLTKGKLSYQYAQDWLENTDAIPLSCSLPLQAEPFDERASRPFFAGLLPEENLRRLIAQQLQVSPQNDFALLDKIGGECAGAVTLLEPGQALPVPKAQAAVQWLSEDELVTILDELPRRPMLAGQDDLRLSLAGAQDKLPVVFDGNQLGLPHPNTPSSHILKPASHAVEDSVTNEGFCLALAASLKLNVAHATIKRVQKHRFLLVERYDRILNAQGQWQRLHQEDFCQAQGIMPELKYQNEGGPNLIQCFDLVRRVTQPSATQVLHLVDNVIFNALIGNHDAHAKNFSLLYIDTKPILAPLYDTLSTAIYPRLTPKMAMQLGSKYKFSEVQTRHWEQFAHSAGLSVAQTSKRIIELAQQLPLAARKLALSAHFELEKRPVIGQILTVIDHRCTLTLKRLVI